MGLSDSLTEFEGIKPKGRKAILDRLLNDLPEKDSAALLAALNDPDRFSARGIYRALSKEGHDVSRSTIYKWRQDRGITQ